MKEYSSTLPAEALDYLNRMRLASNRMGTLIDHLLELSRVARAEVQLSELHLSNLAHAILGISRKPNHTGRWNNA